MGKRIYRKERKQIIVFFLFRQNGVISMFFTQIENRRYHLSTNFYIPNSMKHIAESCFVNDSPARKVKSTRITSNTMNKQRQYKILKLCRCDRDSRKEHNVLSFIND
jgi:hypothetical protein